MFIIKSNGNEVKSTVIPALNLALPKHEQPFMFRLAHFALCSIITFGGAALVANQFITPVLAQSQKKAERETIETHIADIHTILTSMEGRADYLKARGEITLYGQNRLVSERFSKLYHTLVTQYTYSLHEKILFLSEEEQNIFVEIKKVIKGIYQIEKKGTHHTFNALDYIENMIKLIPTEKVTPFIMG